MACNVRQLLCFFNSNNFVFEKKVFWPAYIFYQGLKVPKNDLILKARFYVVRNKIWNQKFSAFFKKNHLFLLENEISIMRRNILHLHWCKIFQTREVFFPIWCLLADAFPVRLHLFLPFTFAPIMPLCQHMVMRFPANASHEHSFKRNYHPQCPRSVWTESYSERPTANLLPYDKSIYSIFYKTIGATFWKSFLFSLNLGEQW